MIENFFLIDQVKGDHISSFLKIIITINNDVNIFSSWSKISVGFID